MTMSILSRLVKFFEETLGINVVHAVATKTLKLIVSVEKIMLQKTSLILIKVIEYILIGDE